MENHQGCPIDLAPRPELFVDPEIVDPVAFGVSEFEVSLLDVSLTDKSSRFLKLFSEPSTLQVVQSFFRKSNFIYLHDWLP